jgi:hypothetical protein
MISIIISSCDSNKLARIKSSIVSTIGVEHEIIDIQNKGLYSIAGAYNKGLELAKFDYICFVHEDVEFKSKNWGALLIDRYNSDNTIGLIGLVGTSLLLKYATGWHQSGLVNSYLIGHIIQGKNSWTDSHYSSFNNSNTDTWKEAAAIDGVFMFTHRKIILSHKFDEKIINDFHGYDLYLSLKIKEAGYKIFISGAPIIYHYSLGKISKKWFTSNSKVLKQFKQKLPINTSGEKINFFIISRLSLLSFYYYFKRYLKYIVLKNN